MSEGTSGYATVSLILGIVSLILGWIPFLGWLLIALAIIFGILGIRDASKGKSGKGLAIAGIVCASVALIIVIIISLTIAMVAHGVKSLETNNQDSLVNTKSQAPIKVDSVENNEVKQPVNKDYALGDTIQAGDFTWKITKVSKTDQIGEEYMGTLMGKKADGIFLIMDVEVENTGKSAKYLMDSYLKLVDDKGREFSPDSTAAIYLKPQGSALMFEQINPGIVKKGKIVFDVPIGLSVANVKIRSNLLGSAIFNVKLII